MNKANTQGRPHYRDPDIAELVIDNAREFAIVTLDDAGTISSWSPGAQRIFGYAPEEALGRGSAMLFCASDLAAEADRKEIETARREGKAEDSRWHIRKSGERFWGNGVLMRLDSGQRSGFLKILRDETAQRRADEQRILLLNELNHRIKNTLATVQSITEQTLRASGVDGDIRTNLGERLLALSAAHDVLVRENWAGAELRDIVARTLAPHAEAGREIRMDGPVVRLSPQKAVSIALAIHELTTNALKYGALSAERGKVSISWNVALDGEGRRHMNLLWEERGGPPVEAPQESGFGMRLITRHIAREAGGAAKVEFDPEGLRCVIEAPLSDAEDALILDLANMGAPVEAPHA